MEFSEMFESLRDSIMGAWQRILFLVRTYRVASFGILVVLVGGLTLWAQSGFSLQFGRSSASTTQKSSPWYYCDYATKACVQSPPNGNAVTSDFDAADCSSAGGGCALGRCRVWEGSGTTLTSWQPLDTPDGLPACEPLTKITATTFPGFATTFFRERPVPTTITPADMDPAPVNWANCLYVEDGYSSGDPSWATMTENSVPQVGFDKTVTYKAFVINNCPWNVHFIWQVSGGPLAGTGQSGGNISADGDIFQEVMPANRDFPSCWNSGSSVRPASCGQFVSMTFPLNTYTCGSLNITQTWWHFANNNQGGSAHVNDDPALGRSFVSNINYGKNCTGSSAEKQPGKLASYVPGGSGPCPPIPAQATVKVAHPTVVCGPTQNKITWENPLSLNAAVNTVLRTETKPNGTTETRVMFAEGGCWTTFGFGTYTDTAVTSGSTYSYAIKTHPNVRSADVACRNGVQVLPSPTTSAGPSSTVNPTTSARPSSTVSTGPVPSYIYSPAPTTFTPTPYPPTPTIPVTCSGDADCDGIPDTIECPNKADCPDSNNDGTPDWQDPNIRNTTGQVLTVGQVQTGPGETTLVALIISALVSLLYVSYAHSPLGLKREVGDISKDQGPMDFRS